MGQAASNRSAAGGTKRGSRLFFGSALGIQVEQVVGKIVARECAKTAHRVVLEGLVPRLSYFSSEVRRAVSRHVWRWSPVARGGHLLMSFSLLVILLTMPLAAWGQSGGVALDNVNSQAFTTGGTGCLGVLTFNCTFNHTTNSVVGTTGLLVVGVSMNITNNAPDSSVTGVTYNLTYARFSELSSNHRTDLNVGGHHGGYPH